MQPEQQEQEEQKSAIRKSVEQGAKKKALNVGKKVAKQIAKKAIKGLAMALKAVASFLIKLISPYILIAIGILILVVILFSATTMFFSFGSSDEIGAEASAIREYTEERVLASVDASKPEQLEYAVPAELVYSVLQLFTSESRTEREINKAIDTVVDKLKPTFVYDSVEEKTESETTSCDRNGCSTSKSNSKTTITYLKHVEAWNGTLDVQMQGGWGEWVSTTSSHSVSYVDDEGNEQSDTVTTTVKTRQYTYISNESWVEDYSAFERILTNAPFKYTQNDIVFIEQLFKLAGGSINYSLIHLGIDDGSGVVYDFDMDGVNIIPGAGVPAEYMQYYLAGQKAYKVDWFLIAAIHYVETKFSTHKPMISYAGAEGHTQFMPCTWVGWAHPTCKGLGKGDISTADKENPAIIKKYGGYGVDADGDGKASMWSIADATMATAKYLASGGNYSWSNRSSVEKAIGRYNHSQKYVNDVYSKAVEFKESASYIGSNTGGGNGPASSYGFIAPTTGVISSSWGKRMVGGKPDIHRAMDIAKNYHAPVYAIADGTVTRHQTGCPYGYIGATCNGVGWGNYVRITHVINGRQFESIYGHLEAVHVRTGQVVRQGTVIGNVGSSGSSSGPHLHIELHSPKRQGADGEINALNPILYLPPIPRN